MASRKKPEFSMTADLEKFKYEVAEEISHNKKHQGLANILGAKTLTKNNS
jgi:hypothetical protein